MTQRLQDFLTEHKMLQREMAAQMGISEEHLSRVLNGKNPLTDSFIGTFAKVFGWQTAEHVFGDGQSQEQPA